MLDSEREVMYPSACWHKYTKFIFLGVGDGEGMGWMDGFKEKREDLIFDLVSFSGHFPLSRGIPVVQMSHDQHFAARRISRLLIPLGGVNDNQTQGKR